MSSLLEVKNVTKMFGGLTANSDVSFTVNEKEILSRYEEFVSLGILRLFG